jgi:cytoskeleton-associated protein 5
MALYREAGRWMGRAIEGKIQKLKKEQQEEILKFVDAIPEGTVMRPLRGSATEDAVSLKDLKDFDAYDHVEAVDALNKYNESWCDKVLALEKWIEKKDALELLLKSVSVTKIHPNPNNLYPIVQMLKKLINHSNVAIQLVAIKIAGYMAGGLRKNFTHSCKIILTPMMQKLKDKKQQVIDEVNGAIKRFFYVLTLDDLMDDIKEVLEDKVSTQIYL